MQIVLLLLSVRSMDWMFSFLRTGKNDAKRVSCSSADAACQHPMEDSCKKALCNYAVKIFDRLFKHRLALSHTAPAADSLFLNSI